MAQALDQKTVTAVIYQQPEWFIIFEVVLASVVIIFLIVAFILLFLRRRNVPISQAIEVDPREPHSITITFIPATSVGKDPTVITTTTTTQNTESANNILRPDSSHSALAA